LADPGEICVRVIVSGTGSVMELSVTVVRGLPVFAAATGTYFDQSGQFFRIGQAPSTDTPESGSDQFWIFDASAGYRLPDRWGIVSIEGKNLFNQSFRYQDTDPFRPIIQPGRTVYFKVTLAL